MKIKNFYTLNYYASYGYFQMDGETGLNRDSNNHNEENNDGVENSEDNSIQNSLPFDPSVYSGKLLPYDAQYVGSYQPLLGWIGKTAKNWIAEQVGVALAKLTNRIEQDIKRVENTVFEESDAPELAFKSAHNWIRDVLMFDGGKQLKQLRKKLAKNKTAPTFAHLQQLIAAIERDKKLRSALKSSSDEKDSSKRLKNNSDIEIETNRTKAINLVVDLAMEKNLSDAYLRLALKNQTANYADTIGLIADTMAQASPSEGITTPARETGLTASPVGLLNLYRYYFYDFGSFLGPPVEHVWISPSSTLELIEAISSTSYRFRESESSFEIVQAEEESVKEAEELSSEMEKSTEQDISAGFSAEGGVNFAVWHASASTSLEYKKHLEKNMKETRKRSKELSSKSSREMKRSIRLLTRESLEKRTESSRKHVISNPTDKLVSYEMHRKMKRIGIQVQHLGTQLCYQIYLDEPGLGLGLGELVHIAKPQDFSTTPPPDSAPPSFPTLTEDYEFEIPFQPLTDDEDDDGDYIEGKLHNDSSVRIKWIFNFKAAPPQPAYELVDAREISMEKTDPDEDRPSRWATSYRVVDPSGEFEVKLMEANFEEQAKVKVVASLIWEASEALRAKSENEYQQKIDEYNQEMERKARLAMIEGLRERIKLARSVHKRPSDELREEERFVLYRQVMRKLMTPEIAAELHAKTELIRAFFEIDKMLYFIAPDWWNPRIESGGGAKGTAMGAFAFHQDAAKYNVVATVYLDSGMSTPAPEGAYVEGVVERGHPDDDNIFFKYKVYILVAPFRYTPRGEEPPPAEHIWVNSLEYRSSTTNPHNPTVEEIGPITVDYDVYETLSMAIFPPPFPLKGSLKITIPNPYSASRMHESAFLSETERVTFGGEHARRPFNYLITEESDPAPIGSSIGWLIQLDGDNHRNAFLNAAWAKIVIPIQRGKEKMAIEWLKKVEGHEGLDADYLDENLQPVKRDDNGGNKSVKEMLDDLIIEIAKTNDDAIFAAKQTVYEHGFNPLADSFQPPGGNPLETFAQWVEIVPSNQVVPVKYEISDES